MPALRRHPPLRLLAAFLAGNLLGAAAGPAAASERPWRRKPRLRSSAKREDARGRRAQSLNRLSGMEFVLSGYDVYLGNPSPTQGWSDPGFTHQIFDAEYSGRTTVDGSRDLPDGISTLSCAGSCSSRADVESVDGANSYSKLLSTRVSLDVSFGNEKFGAKFGASFDYRRVENGSSAHGSVHVLAEAHCCAYKAEVQSFSPPPLTEDFSKAVELAPTEYDSDYYMLLIQEFGTHYVTAAELGGVYGQETVFSRERYADMLSSSVDSKVYAQASFIVSITASAESGLEKNLSKMYQSYSSSQHVYSLGSKPPASGKLEDWIITDVASPAPVRTELRAISYLFSKLFFPDRNVSVLDAQKANMERALTEYCPNYLLPRGQILSCNAPTNDPPMPGQKQTCLGKTDAFGGMGGMPFDDGVANITQNGLFSDVEVARVSYIEGSSIPVYVQSLQLELQRGYQKGEAHMWEVGQKKWYLQQHGKFGDAQNWEVNQGTVITAVQVRWCKYVNSLTFYTSDGDKHAFGGLGGCHTTLVDFQSQARQQFNITASRAWLVGLLGRSDKWIDSVGFYFAYLAPPGEGCLGGIAVPGTP